MMRPLAMQPWAATIMHRQQGTGKGTGKGWVTAARAPVSSICWRQELQSCLLASSKSKQHRRLQCQAQLVAATALRLCLRTSCSQPGARPSFSLPPSLSLMPCPHIDIHSLPQQLRGP
eukprot:COSAG06_NODE_1768_length_8432_cov_5.547822_2_plen_118_part_00